MLKWLMPLVSYLLFVCLLYFIIKIEHSLYGFRPNQGPTVLPNSALWVVFLPLILWGYILLAATQFMYKKSKRTAKILAWMIAILSIALAFVFEWEHINSWLYFFMFNVSQIIVYYFIFFSILFYLFEKEKNKYNTHKL